MAIVAARMWRSGVGLLRCSGESGVARRLAHGTLWLLIGTALWRVLTAVSSIFVARILGGTAFGELAMVRSTVDLFVVFGSFRLGSTATKYVSQYRKTDPARAGAVLMLVLIVSLVTCLVTAALCLLLSPWMAGHVLDRAELSPTITLGAVLIFFATFAAIQEVALAGFEAFRATAFLNAVRGVVAIAVCVPLAALWGVTGVIAALIVDAVLALGVCMAVLWKECVRQGVPLQWSRDAILRELPVLWRFALPGVCAGVLTTGTLWLGRAILVRGTDGFMQLGLFSAANQWRTPMLFLPAVLCRVMLPVVSEAHAERRGTDLKAAIDINLRVVCLTALPVCLLVMGLADVIQGLFGREFQHSGAILRILMPATFLYAVDRVFERVFEGTGRRWTDLAMTGGWSLLFLAVALSAVPRFGGVGLSLAFLLAYAALVAGRIIYVDHVLVPGSIGTHARLLLLCSFALAVVYAGSSYAAQRIAL